MAEERLGEIRQARLAKRQTLLNAGRSPYPAEARRTHTAAELLEQFDTLQAGSFPVTLAGRVAALRRHGGVAFLDLVDASGSVQLQITKDKAPSEVFERLEWLDAGDFVQAVGMPIVTERGVNTLQVNEFHLLSKSIRPLPGAWHGLKDRETRYRQREVDLLLNEEARLPLLLRGQVLDWLRHELMNRGFQEVETPILQPLAGGAVAEPFVTRHNALDTDLYLRIAPELYLKRLLVGGFEKVFEIGRCFRNEGMDRDHSPEFSTCELYWAYADYEDLMDMTEDMLSGMVRNLTGSEEIKMGDETLFFVKPWRRVSYKDALQEAIGVDVLQKKDPAAYVTILENKGLEVPQVQTYSKLVDELYKELVRPGLVQPTMVFDLPVEMAPLAKRSLPNPAVAETFQLLVGGKELIKAYSELNDPVEQRERFEAQQEDRKKGDKEQTEIDEEYLRAMEYGMPPAAGWGLGIDRLVAILSGASSVRDTIAFPLLRPEKK
ncbi:MAG: lysine--tRNA ligase [bacterium]